MGSINSVAVFIEIGLILVVQPEIIETGSSISHFINYFRFDKCLKRGMKRECILSENELNKKRKIIQRNKIKKILNEAEQLTSEEISKLDHGEILITYKLLTFHIEFSVTNV